MEMELEHFKIIRAVYKTIIWRYVSSPLECDHFISFDYRTHVHAHVWRRHTHTRLVELDVITYSGNVRRGLLGDSVGSWTYRFNKVFFHQPGIQSSLPPSLLLNTTVRLLFPLFHPLSSSSVGSLCLSSHILGTLLSRQALLFTFNSSLWILIGRSVFPGSVLIGIMRSAWDSAATSSKPPEALLSWAPPLLVWGSSIRRLCFVNTKYLCFPSNPEFIWSYVHSISALRNFCSMTHVNVSIPNGPSITALSSFCFPLISLIIPLRSHLALRAQLSSLLSLFLHILPDCNPPHFHTLSILAHLHSFKLETIAYPTPQRVTLSTNMCPNWSTFK